MLYAYPHSLRACVFVCATYTYTAQCLKFYDCVFRRSLNLVAPLVCVRQFIRFCSWPIWLRSRPGGIFMLPSCASRETFNFRPTLLRMHYARPRAAARRARVYDLCVRNSWEIIKLFFIAVWRRRDESETCTTICHRYDDSRRLRAHRSVSWLWFPIDRCESTKITRQAIKS